MSLLHGPCFTITLPSGVIGNGPGVCRKCPTDLMLCSWTDGRPCGVRTMSCHQSVSTTKGGPREVFFGDLGHNGRVREWVMMCLD